MSVQVKRRREAASFLAGFVGAQAELIVDTTNNRVQVHDGTTAGGWPAAKLSEVVTNTRIGVADANYTVRTIDRLIAYTALTAARTVTLPASSSFPTGTQLTLVDESGACSSTNTITVTRAGSDTINGASTVAISTPYGFVALESNGAGKWTILDQTPSLAGTGAVVYNSSQSLTAAQQAQAIANIGAVTGGGVNKFRNGTMDVWQRGTSGTATTLGAYTADGWIVVPAGASVTWALAAGRLTTKNSLQVTGASSVTDVIVKQRIESLIAAAFCSQTVTVQAQIYNGTGGAITPKLSINRATGVDNGTYTNVDVNAVSLQSCASATWTLVAYTFAANANSYNGLEVVFDFGNNFSATGKTVQITEVDIRVTPSIATGLNNNPPPPELRPVFAEASFNARYYRINPSLMGGWNSASTTSFFAAWSFDNPMRAVPTLTLLNGSNTVTQFDVQTLSASSITDYAPSTNGTMIGLTTGAVNTGYTLNGYVTAGTMCASAEL